MIVMWFSRSGEFRAGFVGADGPTHAGSFDTTYLATLPGFVVMAAADEAELKHMVRTAAAYDAGVVAMHNRANVDPEVDIVADILGFFEQALERAARAGIRPERIALDPGIGFGKTFEQNLKALASLETFGRLGFPLLLGTSRKSLIGKVIETTPAERLPGTIASNVLGIRAGCAIIRVHDVAAHVQAARVTEAILHAR
ncbi:MAG: hypothetical protein E2577_12185 [Starkeya sp.]|nr:hypothetical protein [Starkeya sp.]